MIHKDPTVDEAGFICFADERLAPADAVKLAYRLTQAVEDSIWRSQKGEPWFNDSSRIVQRANGPLGRAKQALKEVYGLRFSEGKLV